MAVVRLLCEEAAVRTAAETDKTVFPALSRQFTTLRELRGPAVPEFCAQVRHVILVASSSRGGSSMLAAILRASDSLIHLQGEFNPFLRMVGLTYPASGTGSDELDSSHIHGLGSQLRGVFDTELALEAGCAADVIDDDERFGFLVAWRTALQWPSLDLDPVYVADKACRVLLSLRKERLWAPGESDGMAQFQCRLLRELRADGLLVSPRYYDLPAAMLRQEAAGGDEISLPGDALLEESPFILTRPWRQATEADLATKPLVIKTPSNAYRLAFLRATFPNARIRMLHLTRNPAASINGLYDGWLHNGFYAHRMDHPLEIDGYLDDTAHRFWWKFDLPPGWRQFTKAFLLDVCAFQWRASHQAVMDDAGAGHVECLRLRFEDLFTSSERRVRSLARLSDWLGIPFAGPFEHSARTGVGPVCATQPPAPLRWRRRAPMIYPAIRGPVRECALRLGYGNEDTWI